MAFRPMLALAACVALAACESAPAGPVQQPDLTLSVVSGDGQVAAPGAELPDPVVAVVLDARGKPVQDQLVNFRVTAGGGSAFAGSALSDKDGMVREWWTLGPEPGENTLEARAVNATTGAKLVFATFHATAVEPPPADPLAGTWRGVRQDGLVLQYVFVNTGTTVTNWRTGNAAVAYDGTVSGTGIDTQTFQAAFEAPTDLYFGAVSRGELTGPNTLDIWSDYVPRFTLTRRPGA